MYRPFSQAEDGDSALYDYIAQCIVRGQTPYKDVIDIKAPVSFYLSALAMEAGQAVGMRDVLAARLLHIVLAGLLSAVVFLVAEVYLGSRPAAVIAVLVLLTFKHFAFWTVGGGQPKLPMILFGMLTLLSTGKNRPFMAGFCSMLSCLCWQPGLLFTGVAFLVFSRYLTAWRDLRALKVLAGAAVPLAILLFYFRWISALDDLWTWTVAFNYSVYARRTLEGAGNSLRHLFNVTFKIFRADLVLVVTALIGFVMFGVQRLRERLKGMGVQNAADLFRDAIVLAPLVYLAACLVRFNAGPYLIPFLPFIGLFFGWFVVESVRILKAGPIIGDKAAARNVDWLQTGVLVMLITVAAVRAVAYQFEPIPKLREQDKRFEAVSNLLSGPDTIYVHGTTEILVLLNKPNATPYVFLDWGKDDYLAAMKFGGSFEAIIDELESVAPKIVSLSRLQRVAHRDEIRRWVEQHYEAIEMTGYDVYIRKQGPSLIAQ
ncbi:MAG: DolP-mannose mannosyltransferase [Blastocatellia bacterium]